MRDMVLDFDSISDNIKYPTDFCVTIGCFANRINQGCFVWNGKAYILPEANWGNLTLYR